MNANTKEDLQSFIVAVKNLVYDLASHSVARGNSVSELLDAADKLHAQLDKDETILD